MSIAGRTGLHSIALLRRAKLLPPRQPGAFLRRPRLNDALDAGLDRPLTLVVAPGGYGKSSLLASWASRLELPTAWLALDGADNDLRTWAAHLIAAVEGGAGRTAVATRALLKDQTPLDPTELAAALTSDLLDLDADLVLILDDLHHVTEEAARRLPVELLRHPLPNLHLVLASREEPSYLPLPLLRAREQLVELRAVDLRFSESETRDYFSRALADAIEPARLERIVAETGGWPAGITLAAIALRNENYAESDPAAGRGYAIDFLFEEMLARQRPELQTLLIATSIVERVCSSLVCAILGPDVGTENDVIRRLDQLARSNEFVARLGDEDDWYAYHHLFRELLRRRFAVIYPPDEQRALHLNASAWYEAHGEIDAAIAQAISAGDPERAARIVETHALRVPERDGFQAIPRWLAQIPADVIARRPGLQVARSWEAFGQGQPNALHAATAAAIALIERGEHDLDERSLRIIQGHVAVHSIYVGIPDAELTTAEASADFALATLPADHEGVRGWTWLFKGIAMQATGRAEEAIAALTREFQTAPRDAYALRWRCLSALCDVLMCEGRLRSMIEHARMIVAMSEAEGDAFSHAWGEARIGIGLLLLGEPREAERHLQRVRPLHRRMNRTIWRDAMLALQMALQLLQRPEEAVQVEHELFELLTRNGDLENLSFARSMRARRALIRGAPATAGEWLESTGELISPILVYRFETDTITRLKVLLALGGEDELRRLVAEGDALLRELTELHARLSECEVRLLIGAACARLGDRARARHERAAALRIATGTGLALPFHELRPLIAPLLATLTNQERYALPAWLNRAIADQAAHQGGAASGASRWWIDRSANDRSPAPLTEREAQILVRMADHKSNKEIAEDLSISPLTVKRHASNLYEKLGVGERRQAVEQAAAIGLLKGPAGPQSFERRDRDAALEWDRF